MATFLSGTAGVIKYPLARLFLQTPSSRSGSAVQKKITASPDKAVGGLPRFFVPKLPSLQGMTISIDGDEFWHMSKVLRLAVDDRVELLDGKGNIVEGVVARVGRSSIDVAALEEIRYLSPTGPFWHVAAAFGSLKGGRADWFIEKCTELGATSVIPLLSKRSPKVGDGRNDRWNRMVVAATKQCQRLHSLDVKNPTELGTLLLECASYDVILMADAYATPLLKALPRVKMDWNGLLLIGPEGGWFSRAWFCYRLKLQPPDLGSWSKNIAQIHESILLEGWKGHEDQQAALSLFDTLSPNWS